MSYLIDGYNFLFRLQGKVYPSFERRRQALIELLAEELVSFRVPISIVFDSSEQFKDYAQKAIFPPIEVIYAPKGKTADSYMVELVELSRSPRTITVVTSDIALGKECTYLGSELLSIEEFIALIERRRKGKPSGDVKPEIGQSRGELERLRAIFEERLKESGRSP